MSVLDEIKAEREHQDEVWGGPEHDDQHPLYKWFKFIGERLQQLGKGSLPQTRRLFIEIAALAVAAVESLDRHLKS